MNIIPSAFLFRYTLPVQRVDRLPRAKPPLLKLPESCALPWPSVLDGGHAFASLAVAWNPEGLGFEINVTGKPGKPFCVPEAISSSDSLLIWIDTRDTQSQHRGSRFCHHFVALPTGGGDSGLEPVIRQLPVPRAREDSPDADPETLLVESEIRKDGYRLAVWLPREALHGYEPGSQSRLGFYAAVHDTNLGLQTLTVGPEFPFEADPSQWVSLEMVEG
ncbi:DOMON domain-containing protein [Planctomicrobium piriforme]|uniref:Carbohydrate-binding domain-containing protein n=1 Tax=Planctomicrobium piriforme TaxID=1576369 RepID=A0A1I3K3B6_9PLAN|nr:hypothetical protein [Planctomicrobium piriforme]SFI66695.1 hypothetical protein SAMN05421753_11197 [Planctomicrobium piriforme]